MPRAHPSLLVVTRTSPFPGASGSGTYVFDVLRHLAACGWIIHVAWTTPPDLLPSRGWYSPPPAHRGICRLELRGMIRLGQHHWMPSVVWLPRKARALHAVKTVLRTLRLWPAGARRAAAARVATPAAAWDAACSGAELDWVRATITRLKPDVVLANYSWMAPAAHLPEGPPVALLTHDVRHRQIHLRDGRAVEVLGEFMSAEHEHAQLAAARLVVAIQSAEAAVLRRMLPDTTVVTAPLSVAARPLPAPGGATVLFVGSANGANLAGLQWLTTEVWPLVRTALPQAELLLAGTICLHPGLPSAPGLRLLGPMEDLSAAYRQASAVAVPLLRGSGVKIKLLEAVTHARTAVTTAVGLEGLEALAPALRTANTPAAFAAALVDLLAHPDACAQLGHDALRLAAQAFSPAACYGPLDTALRRLAVAPRP